jgi:hypothetical protein
MPPLTGIGSCRSSRSLHSCARPRCSRRRGRPQARRWEPALSFCRWFSRAPWLRSRPRGSLEISRWPDPREQQAAATGRRRSDSRGRRLAGNPGPPSRCFCSVRHNSLPGIATARGRASCARSSETTTTGEPGTSSRASQLTRASALSSRSPDSTHWQFGACRRGDLRALSAPRADRGGRQIPGWLGSCPFAERAG